MAGDQFLAQLRAAIALGTADLAENAAKFDKDDPDYQLVRIEQARKDGILPIGFDAASSFKERTE